MTSEQANLATTKPLYYTDDHILFYEKEGETSLTRGEIKGLAEPEPDTLIPRYEVRNLATNEEILLTQDLIYKRV